MGVPYTSSLQASGGTPNYSWTVASGTLPAGLKLEPSSGQVSGTPTATGTYTFVAQVADQNNPSASKTTPASITVASTALVVTSSALPGAASGQPYTAQLTASGGTPGYNWVIRKGALPAGLTLSNNGAISGTPTASGTYNFTTQVSDSSSPGQTANAAAALTVSGGATSPLVITSSALAPAPVGSNYNASFAASGGTPGYTWSLASGTLPNGLTLSPTSGAITGTPQHEGRWPITVAVTDSGSPAQVKTAQATVAVFPTPLTIGNTALSSAISGSAYTGSLNASGGTPGYTWSLSGGSLPAGLTLSPAGVLSGTPTASGTYNFSALVRDGGSPAQMQTASTSIVVTSSTLVITSSNLSSATTGKAYTGTLSANGGTPGYSWSVVNGSLPAGLTLSPAGQITGTPTTGGNFNFTASVRDNSSPAQTQTAATSIAVSATTLAITNSNLSSATTGKAYAGTLSASGGTPGYSWSIVNGNLPAGLTLSPAGQITGTPTAGGNFNFTAAVRDNSSPAQSQTAATSINVATAASSLVITSGNLGSAATGKPYAASLSATGGTPGYSWTIVNGSLPAGLTLSPAGQITGTPTTGGNFNFTASVRDNSSPAQTQTQATAINVSSSATTLSISAPTFRPATANTPFTGTLSASGGTPGYQWSIVSGSLPSGLSLSATTGAITGTPTSYGRAVFTAQVSDSGSPAQTQTAQASILIAPLPLTILSSTLAQGGTGQAYGDTLKATGGVVGYHWAIVDGSLPPGLVLSSTTGAITGTPTATGTFHFSTEVADSGAPPQLQTGGISLTVTAPSALTLRTPALPSGTGGVFYSSTLQASGGTPGYNWAIRSGSLPPGLTLATNSGVISGTPTANGSFSFTAAVADQSNPSQTQSAPTSILIASNALAITSSGLSAGTNGTAYSATLQAAGGTPAYRWSILSGNLPTGLTLSPSGTISGSPTASGTFHFTAGVTDSSSPTQAVSSATSITVSDATQAASGPGQTWYVRPDGGSRYSSIVTLGQCDGMSDAPYAGTGTNQHCAFNDFRFLWQDGSFTNSSSPSQFPAYGWIGNGGDTYLVRGSIATGVSYRVGWPSADSAFDPAVGHYWGVAGDAYDSEPPPPLSGTAGQHTRILGENYLACHAATAKTSIYGGFGLNAVIRMNGASYVDVSCLDITDHSSCGVQGQEEACLTHQGRLTDFAKNGISWGNTSTHDTLNDVHIHGMASAGMIGPTGDGVEMHYLDVIGNASSGWNADDSSGTTGTGSLLVQNFNIAWNGCAEEYPMVDALPYNDCTDDSGSGYGDGFGTATLISVPSWNATFDQGVVNYNTQDGLDALHLSGAGSSMTITRVLAYGNMGQQIKIGGAKGLAANNLLVGNCEAMRLPIPGTPEDYNKHLSDFCRAGDSTLALTVNNNRSLQFLNNTVYSAAHTVVDLECDPQGGGDCDTRSTVDFENNLFLGFLNSVADGYPDPHNFFDTANYANPIYNGTDTRPFTNPGSVYTNNLFYHAKTGWDCQAYGGAAALCNVDPNLVDETWHLYGYGNMSPAGGSATAGAGAPIPSVSVDYSGQTRGNPPAIGAYEK